MLDLAEDDIAGVMYSLGNTIGDYGDVPYFAPRFCLDGMGGPLYDVTLGFSLMARADFASWPVTRRNAIRAFLIAQESFVLAGPSMLQADDSLNGIGSVYACMAYLGFDADFFATWARAPAMPADEHFVDLLGGLKFRKAKRSFDLRCAWMPVDIEALLAWLRTPNMLQRLKSRPVADAVREANVVAFLEAINGVDASASSIDQGLTRKP